MLFESRFREGIRDGELTLTFRRWKRSQAKAGGEYRLWGSMKIRVLEVAQVPVNAISGDEARAAGFADRDELLAYMAQLGPLDAGEEVYRIAFEYAGEARPEPDKPVTEDEVARVMARLRRMDSAASHGPWTGRALGLISELPQVRAAELARRAGRETQPFKQDVRKLKALGLTRSFEVGYELTPLGRRALQELAPPAG